MAILLLVTSASDVNNPEVRFQPDVSESIGIKKQDSPRKMFRGPDPWAPANSYKYVKSPEQSVQKLVEQLAAPQAERRPLNRRPRLDVPPQAPILEVAPSSPSNREPVTIVSHAASSVAAPTADPAVVPIAASAASIVAAPAVPEATTAAAAPTATAASIVAAPAAVPAAVPAAAPAAVPAVVPVATPAASIVEAPVAALLANRIAYQPLPLTAPPVEQGLSATASTEALLPTTQGCVDAETATTTAAAATDKAQSPFTPLGDSGNVGGTGRNPCSGVEPLRGGVGVVPEGNGGTTSAAIGASVGEDGGRVVGEAAGVIGNGVSDSVNKGVGGGDGYSMGRSACNSVARSAGGVGYGVGGGVGRNVGGVGDGVGRNVGDSVGTNSGGVGRNAGCVGDSVGKNTGGVGDIIGKNAGNVGYGVGGGAGDSVGRNIGGGVGDSVGRNAGGVGGGVGAGAGSVGGGVGGSVVRVGAQGGFVGAGGGGDGVGVGVAPEALHWNGLSGLLPVPPLRPSSLFGATVPPDTFGNMNSARLDERTEIEGSSEVSTAQWAASTSAESILGSTAGSMESTKYGVEPGVLESIVRELHDIEMERSAVVGSREGLACSVEGTWSAQMAGVRLDISCARAGPGACSKAGEGACAGSGTGTGSGSGTGTGTGSGEGEGAGTRAGAGPGAGPGVAVAAATAATGEGQPSTPDAATTLNMCSCSASGGNLQVKVSPLVPPCPRPLLCAEWRLRGSAPFPRSGLFTLTGQHRPSKRMLTFTGQCKVCGGTDTITGVWVISREPRDCRDTHVFLSEYRDIFRREAVHSLREKRLRDMKNSLPTAAKRKQSCDFFPTVKSEFHEANLRSTMYVENDKFDQQFNSLHGSTSTSNSESTITDIHGTGATSQPKESNNGTHKSKSFWEFVFSPRKNPH